MTTSNSKTAEFARLFDFFDRLASRKVRNGSHNDDTTIAGMEDVRSVPADLAPVVKSLAALVGTRKLQDDARQEKKKTAARTLKNTIASLSHDMLDADDEYDEDEESLAKFPLGKRYPFTFRMMLHKLYQMDDWAQKVKEVLEMSQIEYKPLAEQAVVEVKVEIAEEKSEGRIHFKPGVATGGSRRPAMRPRSHSVAVVGKGRDYSDKGLASPVKPPKHKEPPHEEIRVVKKRCVGRRKSMSGPISADTGRIGGVWIYDAAVSSVEFTGRDTIEHAAPRRPRYQSLGTGAKKDREEPQQNRDGMVARRRALSVLDNMKHREGR